MTKPIRITFVLAILVFPVLAGLIWVYSTRWTVEKVDYIIKKETPIGTSITSIEAMLTKYNFQHSTYIEGLDLGNFDEKKTEKLEGIAKGFIAAHKRDVGWNLLIRWDIAVIFYFNDKGELIDYTIRWVGTGP